MPVLVPTWIARDLNLAESYETEAELASAVEDSLTANPIAMVSGADIVDALSTHASDEIEVLPANSRGAWRFAEISVGGSVQCQVLEPGVEWISIPTNSIRLILWAWSKREEYSPAIWAHSSDSVIVRWPFGASVRRPEVKLILSACGIAQREQWISQPMSLGEATNFEVATNSVLLREQLVYAELLQAAIRHTSPSLRFLYLYRLFEHAYLIGALDRLQSNFFADPKRSTKALSDIVGNEKAAFLALLEASSTKGDFETIADIFEDNQRTRSNRFLTAIHDGAIADGEISYPEKWKRGCVLCYKVRCSIVHSGKSSPIFESFPDAAQGVAALLQSLESASLGFLGLTIG